MLERKKKLEINIKYNKEKLRKKYKPPVGIEPKIFQGDS